MKEVPNNKEGKPMRHYLGLYEKLDPESAAARCLLAYSSQASEFELDYLGNAYGVSHPEFKIRMKNRRTPVDAAAYEVSQILIIRYMLFAGGAPASERYLAYSEVPWGETYAPNFYSRCVNKLAEAFGHDLGGFIRACRLLGGMPLSISGGASCELRFIGDLAVRITVWESDEDFPPSAQFLFSGNFPAAFSAEDMAVIGEVCLRALREAAALY